MSSKFLLIINNYCNMKTTFHFNNCNLFQIIWCLITTINCKSMDKIKIQDHQHIGNWITNILEQKPFILELARASNCHPKLLIFLAALWCVYNKPYQIRMRTGQQGQAKLWVETRVWQSEKVPDMSGRGESDSACPCSKTTRLRWGWPSGSDLTW